MRYFEIFLPIIYKNSKYKLKFEMICGIIFIIT